MSTKLIQMEVPFNWTLNQVTKICDTMEAEYNKANNTIEFGFVIEEKEVIK